MTLDNVSVSRQHRKYLVNFFDDIMSLVYLVEKHKLENRVISYEFSIYMYWDCNNNSKYIRSFCFVNTATKLVYASTVNLSTEILIDACKRNVNKFQISNLFSVQTMTYKYKLCRY